MERTRSPRKTRPASPSAQNSSSVRCLSSSTCVIPSSAPHPAARYIFPDGCDIMYGLTAVRRTHVIAWVAAALSVSVAGIGWLHTTQGRRLLTELGVKCPVDSVDSRTVVSIRNKAILQEKGVSAARNVPRSACSLIAVRKRTCWKNAAIQRAVRRIDPRLTLPALSRRACRNARLDWPTRERNMVQFRAGSHVDGHQCVPSRHVREGSTTELADRRPASARCARRTHIGVGRYHAGIADRQTRGGCTGELRLFGLRSDGHRIPPAIRGLAVREQYMSAAVKQEG